jgi:hypothetical protein
VLRLLASGCAIAATAAALRATVAGFAALARCSLVALPGAESVSSFRAMSYMLAGRINLTAFGTADRFTLPLFSASRTIGVLSTFVIIFQIDRAICTVTRTGVWNGRTMKCTYDGAAPSSAGDTSSRHVVSSVYLLDCLSGALFVLANTSFCWAGVQVRQSFGAAVHGTSAPRNCTRYSRFEWMKTEPGANFIDA